MVVEEDYFLNKIDSYHYGNYGVDPFAYLENFFNLKLLHGAVSPKEIKIQIDAGSKSFFSWWCLR